MANELRLTSVMRFVKGDTDISLGEAVFVDVTGSRYTRQIQNVGTTEEALDLVDITSPGYILVVNRDRTNFVSLRRATGEGNLIKIRPGKFALFELEATAPFAIANTAACNVEILLIET